MHGDEKKRGDDDDESTTTTGDGPVHAAGYSVQNHVFSTVEIHREIPLRLQTLEIPVKEHQLARAQSANGNLFLLDPFYCLYPSTSLATRDPPIRAHLYELGNDGTIEHCFFDLSFGDPVIYKLSNSVNGLVFAASYSACGLGHHCWLLNPFSREVVKLPSPGKLSSRDWDMSAFALGIDTATGVYKVVRLFTEQGVESNCQCQVLSVGPRQEWHYAGVALCFVPFSKPASFVDRTLFWVVLSRHDTTYDVMSFDLKDHKVRMIPTPENIVVDPSRVNLLG